MKIFTLYFRYLFIRFLYLLLFILLAFGGYFYTVPQLEIGELTLTNPLFTDIEHLSAWLYDVDYFIFIFAVAIVILLSLIVFYNIAKKRREKQDKKFLTVFIKGLYSYLFSEEDISDNDKANRLKKLKRELKSDHIKRLFINTIIDLHSQTEGIVKEKVSNIFIGIKLNYLIKAYLHSPYIRHKLFALKVISEFEMKGYDKYILKLTKKKNNVLHAEAIVTLLKLRVYNNLSFLNDLNMKLTLWDINMIVKTIQELNIKNLNYRTLIESVIPEVSTLGLILTRLHGRKDLKTEVSLKIGHSNSLVNEEAFITLVTFAENPKDFEFLIDKFGIAPKKAQILIIRSMDKYENREKAFEFLDWVVLNKPITHKTESIRKILDIDLSAVSRYKQSDDAIIRQSCLQVLDINI